MNISLPVTFDEAERLAFTRAFARRLQEPGEVGSWFGAEESCAFLRRILRVLLLTADGRMALVDWAKLGDEISQAVLNGALLEYQSLHKEPPTEIQYYNQLLVRRLIPANISWGGPKKQHKLLHDICVCVMVAADCGRFGSKPTGRSARRRSGCSIVGEALEVVDLRMNADAVEKIWERYGRFMPPPEWSGWKELL